MANNETVTKTIRFDKDIIQFINNNIELIMLNENFNTLSEVYEMLLKLGLETYQANGNTLTEKPSDFSDAPEPTSEPEPLAIDYRLTEQQFKTMLVESVTGNENKVNMLYDIADVKIILQFQQTLDSIEQNLSYDIPDREQQLTMQKAQFIQHYIQRTAYLYYIFHKEQLDMIPLNRLTEQSSKHPFLFIMDLTTHIDFSLEQIKLIKQLFKNYRQLDIDARLYQPSNRTEVTDD